MSLKPFRPFAYLMSIALLSACATPAAITPTLDERSHTAPRSIHLIVVRAPEQVFVLPQWWYSRFLDRYGTPLAIASPLAAMAALPLAFGTDVSDDRRLREMQAQRYMWPGAMNNKTLERRLQGLPRELSTGKNWRVVGTTFLDNADGVAELVSELHSGPTTNLVIVLDFVHYVTPNLEHLRADVRQTVYSKTLSGSAFGATVRTERRFSYVSPAQSVEVNRLNEKARAEARAAAEARFESLIEENPEKSRHFKRLLKLKLAGLEKQEVTPAHVILNETWSPNVLDHLLVQSVDHLAGLIRSEWAETAMYPKGLEYKEKLHGVDYMNRPYTQHVARLGVHGKSILLRNLSGNYLSVPNLDIQASREAPRLEDD